MSLIERAVARLTEAQAQPSVADARRASESGPEEREPTIARLADRLAESTPRGGISPLSAQGAETAAEERVPAPAARVQDASPRAAGEHQAVRIDLDALRVRGMVVPSGPPTPASHEFRIIKRPLLDNAFGRSGQPMARSSKRIMVTSAFPGEGKSFCAINLAISIAAERDHAVVLVDADVARPSIPRELGIPASAGLMDWLVGEERDLSRLVLRTNVDKLSILHAGRRHEHATELLASEAMAGMLDALSDAYPDTVFVFDSPPLLVTTEARVLASYMGQVVMVVEAGKTPREAVTTALSTIESREHIGLVLNKAVNSESSGYYPGYGAA